MNRIKIYAGLISVSQQEAGGALKAIVYSDSVMKQTSLYAEKIKSLWKVRGSIILQQEQGTLTIRVDSSWMATRPFPECWWEGLFVNGLCLKGCEWTIVTPSTT